MRPLVLEGDTLGKRQQHYNKLLEKVITGEIPSPKSGKIIPGELDIENFLKIDIADNNKDVEYILEVLKSEDMLYVSRAIKRCTWLITDPQYAHIINPEYLHSQLFPLMTSKAKNKLMLQIRLRLREESRVEAFYNYFKDNLETAFKWLQYCSLSFIEKEILTHHEEISRDKPLLKRLCLRSFTFLQILCKLDCGYIAQYLMFLINTHTDEYLSLIESFKMRYRPRFGAKATAVIMKKCPQRITNNFDEYADIIDLDTFGKLLKTGDIKEFLFKQFKNDKLKSWFVFDNLKHIVRYMPEEERFDFLKKIFIEKAQTDAEKIVPHPSDVCSPKPSWSNTTQASSASMYSWYRFAPFYQAFTDIKKVISLESSPIERNSLLAVLMSCAGSNAKHTRTVLQYYHDKHINEPFNLKVQFANIVLSQTATHKFDKKTWNILNNIFCSMEVYIESNNNVQFCIESIIVYKVLHNEKVPDTIENKLKMSSLQLRQGKYNNEEKEKIFNYLLSLLRNRMLNESINHETQLKEAVTLLENVLSLLIDWKKDLADYPWVLNLIKQFVKIHKDNNWKVDFKPLFNKNKSWRKLMFEESLVMSPSEKSCLNALKHDPGLLRRHKNEIEALRRNDAVSLRRLLSKLRVYWPQTLASEWTDSYLLRLNEAGGHKSLTIGICTLLPQKHLLEILRKYAPTESKLNWSDENELILSLRKHLAKNAHLARPLLPLDEILPYAQGDYLQHALPSINGILYNVSYARSSKYIFKLLDAPVSLQKHGIRLAFMKLNTTELKETLPNLWKTAKNLTIRAVLFKRTYKLLCKEKTPLMIEEIWEILSAFIDNLSADENKTIIRILGKIENVPLVVRGKYCMKSHKYLKSLPANANCENIVQKIVSSTVYIMEDLGEDFVAEILLEVLEKKFITQVLWEYGEILVSYLLSAKTEGTQRKRFERILGPLLDKSFGLWNLKIDNKCFIVRKNVSDVLKNFCRFFILFVFEKDMVYPVKMFKEILNKIEGKLTVELHYVILRLWKQTVRFVEILEEHKELVSTIRKSEPIPPRDEYFSRLDDKTWNEVFIKATAKFAESCLEYLREDIEIYGPSTWLAYADALKEMCFCFKMSTEASLLFIKYLFREEFIESYLLALKVLPHFYNISSDEEHELFKEIRKIIYLHPSPEVKLHYCRDFKLLDQDFENNIPME